MPLAVPFIAVAQEVAASAQEEARHRLGAQLQVFGALRWLVTENLDTPTLLRRLEGLSGYDVFLCTPQGRPLLPGVPVPDPAVLPASVDAPPTIPGGFVIPVPAPGGPAGFLVAYERQGARPAGLAVVQHIATVAALRLAMVRNERETLRREGAETLAELLQEILDPEAARRRLARHAIEGDTVLLIVRRTTDEALLRCLEDRPHLLLTRGEDRYVLGAPELAAAVGELPAVAAGTSRPFLPGAALKVAQREALWAVSKAVESGRPVVRYGDDGAGRWLPDDPAVLTALVEHVLGDVLRYDETHDSQLLVSARTWMERDRRTETAAAALHIHPNTLAYRLRRFGALADRDLTSTGRWPRSGWRSRRRERSASPTERARGGSARSASNSIRPGSGSCRPDRLSGPWSVGSAQARDEEFDQSSRVVAGVVVGADAEVADAAHQLVGVRSDRISPAAAAASSSWAHTGTRRSRK